MKKFFIPILIAVGLIDINLSTAQTLPQNGRFVIIELPYSTDALAPIISQQTIELHYGKHLQGYVNTLNRLLDNTAPKGASLEEIVCSADGKLFDNAGQTLNHFLYFLQFSPKASPMITDSKLARAIKERWGSEEQFRKEFTEAGTSLFGSGWVWLAANEDGELSIELLQGGANPIVDGLTPLLGFDVWEHAYYLDYHNRRAEHLNALWQIVDWPTIELRYKNINK